MRPRRARLRFAWRSYSISDRETSEFEVLTEPEFASPPERSRSPPQGTEPQGALTSHEPSRFYTPDEPFRAHWTAEKAGAQAAPSPLPVEGLRAVVPPRAGARALLQCCVPAGSAHVGAVEGAAEIPGDSGGPGKAQRAEPALSGTGLQPYSGHTGRVASRGREGNRSKLFSAIVAIDLAATTASYAPSGHPRSGSVRARADGPWSGSGNASGAGGAPSRSSGSGEERQRR